MKNCIRIAAEKGDPELVTDIFYDRYIKEINRRARTYCDREKVNMVRRVDFGEKPKEDESSEDQQENSGSEGDDSIQEVDEEGNEKVDPEKQDKVTKKGAPKLNLGSLAGGGNDVKGGKAGKFVL